MSQTIYLDNHATTACDQLVVQAMIPYFSHIYGNPASLHSLGIEANEAVTRARDQVAKLIGAQPEEIFFTSGATESNNLAIQGATAKHQRAGGKRKSVAISAIEHKSVTSPCHYLSELGWEIVILPVDQFGTVKLDIAEKLIDESTLLVSVQAANSEIGTIQPVAAVAQLAHQVGALMHCDASQAIAKIPVDVDTWDVDLLSLSGHKMHGPKGIGALYVRGKDGELPLNPLIRGGSQERRLRAGTLPVPLLVGLGEACQLSQNGLIEHSQQIRVLRDQLEQAIVNTISSVRINGNVVNRLPNNSNITFFDIEAEMLMANLPDIILSTGSACESGSIEPSIVLTNIGMDYEECFCTIRFGLSRYNTNNEIDRVSDNVIEAWRNLASISLARF